MTEICQRCKEYSEDLRTLQMACFYDMTELGLPFRIDGLTASDGRKFYNLRVCKECRASWMGAIKEWFNGRSAGRFI